MPRGLRKALWLVAAAQGSLALLFAFHVGWAVELWPFGGGPLTHLFVGSIFAAAAASTAWCLLRDAPRAFVGIGLDYVVILLPLGLYAFARSTGDVADPAGAAAFGVACLAGAALGVVLLRSALRAPWRDSRPTPRPVRWSFGLFAAVLLLVSSSLIVRVDVLPWPVSADQSTAIGLMFLGAGAYFVYGLVRPRWENAGGQLAGFLAYDLVLVGPFLDRLPDIAAEYRVELVVYTAIVAYSAVLATWYLLLARPTRAAVDAPSAATS